MEELVEVTSAKPFVGKSQNYDEDGLFSERIFGPLKNYRCKCGKLNNKILDGGKRCGVCGVLCDVEELRSKTFAKINIPFGFIKPLKKKSLYKILGNKNKQLIEPVMAQASLANKRYLGIKFDGTELKLFNDLDMENNYYKIPLRITGIYSLILTLKYTAFTLNLPVAKQFFDDNVISYNIKVLPPNIRPLAFLGDENDVKITDINKSYLNIIRKNDINKFLINNLEIDEEDWLGMIHISMLEGANHEELVEHGVIEYDRHIAAYQYNIDQIYELIYDALHGKSGFVRSKILGKTLEFSARSVIRTDPSLKPYEIKVSKSILYKLWHPYFLYYLINIRDFDGDFCFEQICSKVYKKHQELFDDFLTWFYEGDSCGK